jgi:hypothetical protein
MQLFSPQNLFWALPLLLVIVVIFYGVPIGYIFYNRHSAAIQTRSPWMIIVCLLLLSGDSIISTVTSALNIAHHPGFICKAGIVNNSICFIGAMIFYLMRIYRVYRFFSLYKTCLE